MSSVNVTIRMDQEVKHEADEMLGELGLSLSTLVSLTVKQMLRDGKLPFVPSIEKPNSELERAIEESVQGKNMSRTFTSVDDAMKDLLA